MFQYDLHCTRIAKYDNFPGSIPHSMEFIDLSLNIFILLMRFLFRITKYKYCLVSAILITVLISCRNISVTACVD